MCTRLEEMTVDELACCSEAVSGITGQVSKEEKGPLFPYERSMRLKLLREWARATKTALRDIQQIINQGFSDRLHEEEIKEILRQLDQTLGEEFGAVVREDIDRLLDKSYRKGKRDVLTTVKLPIVVGAIDTEAIEWLQDHHMYWVRNFYSKHVSGGIADIIADGMVQGLGRAEIGDMLEGALANYKGIGVNPPAYWRGLAANGMNRSRNFGQIQGFVDAEIRELEILAIIDERTSPICRELNGKIISTQAGVRQRNALMNATSPEEVKEIAPWRSAEEVKNMAPDNVGMPPYHFHCRTTVVPK